MSTHPHPTPTRLLLFPSCQTLQVLQLLVCVCRVPSRFPSNLLNIPSSCPQPVIPLQQVCITRCKLFMSHFSVYLSEATRTQTHSFFSLELSSQLYVAMDTVYRFAELYDCLDNQIKCCPSYCFISSVFFPVGLIACLGCCFY